MTRPNQIPPLRESEVLRQCLAYLALTPVFAWRNNTGATQVQGRYLRFGLVGSSDILGVLPGGRLLAVECKRPGGRTTPAQRAFLSRVGELGGLSLTVFSVEGLRRALREQGYDVP